MSRDRREGPCAGTTCPEVLLTLLLIGALSCAPDTPNPTPSPESMGSVPAAAKPSATSSGEPTCNVLIVTFDTTRADHLGCYGSTMGGTPNIDRWSEQAVLFERALSPAPVTMPSHSSLFTGLDPILHGVRDNGIFCLDEGVETLAERLADAGYETAAFVSAEVLSARYGIAQGFATYDQPRPVARNDGLRPGERRAGETIDVFEAWSKETAREPWFAWIHFFDPHQPLVAPAEFALRFENPYLAEIAYADAQFGRLLEILHALGLEDRTLVVLTADHGESRGEHDEPTHGLGLHDSTQWVPLLFRAPGAVSRRIGGQVGLVDVFPTVLEWLGLEPPDDLCGRSLLAALKGGPAVLHDLYLETQLSWFSYQAAPLEAISTGAEKLIVVPGPDPRPALFDLVADPHELQDLAESDPQSVTRLMERLTELRHGRSALPGAPTRALSEEERQRLQQLGYFEGTGPGGSGDPSRAPLPAKAMPLIDRLQLAIAAAEAGNLDKALADVSFVVEHWPDHAIAHGVYGQVLRDRGDPRAARAEFEKALTLRPDLPVTVIDLARLQMDQKQPNKALKTLNAYLDRDPAHLEVLMLAAEIAGKKGDYPASLAYLGRAEELDMSPEQRAELERRLIFVKEQAERGGR